MLFIFAATEPGQGNKSDAEEHEATADDQDERQGWAGDWQSSAHAGH
jgi:hypothetical protein